MKLERLENECEIREILEVGWANQKTWQVKSQHSLNHIPIVGFCTFKNTLRCAVEQVPVPFHKLRDSESLRKF